MQDHVDVYLEFAQPVEEGQEPKPPAKVWFRNTELRCLDLSGNEVKDRSAVEACLRWYYRAPASSEPPRVFLGGNPVAAALQAAPLPAPAVTAETPEVEIGWLVEL